MKKFLGSSKASTHGDVGKPLLNRQEMGLKEDFSLCILFGFFHLQYMWRCYLFKKFKLKYFKITGKTNNRRNLNKCFVHTLLRGGVVEGLAGTRLLIEWVWRGYVRALKTLSLQLRLASLMESKVPACKWEFSPRQKIQCDHIQVFVAQHGVWDSTFCQSLLWMITRSLI